MNKKIEKLGQARLHLEAGNASMKPPIGPLLASYKKTKGIDLCKEFNEKTKGYKNKEVLPTDLTFFSNGSFEMKIHKPTITCQVMQELGIEKAISKPGRGTPIYITSDQIKKIAANKLEDLNCYTIDAAIKTIRSSLKSMGIQEK